MRGLALATGAAATLLGLGLSVTGCRGDYRSGTPGDVRALVVTGTDGQVTDPVQVSPTDNLGRFTVDFNLVPGKRIFVQALIKSPTSSDAVTFRSYCCDTDGGCSPGRFSCQYVAGGTLACDNQAPVSLTGFISRHGGLPNPARLVLHTEVDGCNTDDFDVIQHEASRGVVLH